MDNPTTDTTLPALLPEDVPGSARPMAGPTGEIRRKWQDLSGTIKTNATAQRLAHENTGRESFFFQNQSADTLFLEWDGDAKLGQPSVQVAAGFFLSLEKEKGFVPTGRISVIGPNAGAAFAAREY